MVVGLRGTLGLGVALALAVMLWRLVERTVAAVGAGGPARADELLIGLTASLALACVLWLALGLMLGLLAQVPGSLGRVALAVAEVLTPRLLRQGAGFVLGVGVVAGLAPGTAVAEPPSPSSSISQAWSTTAGPDAVSPSLPDPGFHSLPDPSWVPAAPTVRPQADVGLLSRAPADTVDTRPDVVVQRGDTLWTIAARHLGPGASDAEIAQAWPAWFDANRGVIGDDPDLILPGQVLRAPEVTVQ